MKKLLAILLWLLILHTVSSAQHESWKKKEIRLAVGHGWTQVRGTCIYQDEWNLELLSSVQEETRIQSSSRNGLILTASLSYLLKPNFGFQAGLGYMNLSVPNEASFNFTWTGTTPHKELREWSGNGSFCVVPLNINAIGKWKKKSLEAFVSGGASLFFNRFQSSSFAGYGVSEVYKVWIFVPPKWYLTTYQFIDALKAALKIDEKWISLGMNLGLGLDYKLSPELTLTAEARYYWQPQRNCGWEWRTKTYNGILPPATYGNIRQGNINDWIFTKEDAAYAERLTTPLTIIPSFFQLTFGSRFLF
ncbi:MAG: hypothetical protein WCC06_06065 [Candidatus Aminicenantales bacterium]